MFQKTAVGTKTSTPSTKETIQNDTYTQKRDKRELQNGTISTAGIPNGTISTEGIKNGTVSNGTVSNGTVPHSITLDSLPRSKSPDQLLNFVHDNVIGKDAVFHGPFGLRKGIL